MSARHLEVASGDGCWGCNSGVMFVWKQQEMSFFFLLGTLPDQVENLVSQRLR